MNVLARSVLAGLLCSLSLPCLSSSAPFRGSAPIGGLSSTNRANIRIVLSACDLIADSNRNLRASVSFRAINCNTIDVCIVTGPDRVVHLFEAAWSSTSGVVLVVDPLRGTGHRGDLLVRVSKGDTWGADQIENACSLTGAGRMSGAADAEVVTLLWHLRIEYLRLGATMYGEANAFLEISFVRGGGAVGEWEVKSAYWRDPESSPRIRLGDEVIAPSIVPMNGEK